MRQYLVAFLIGVTATAATCVFFLVFVFLPFAGSGDRNMWIAVLAWIAFPAIAGHASGRALARRVDRSWTMCKVLLATPWTYLTLGTAVIALLDSNPSVFLETVVGVSLLALPSVVFTIIGFNSRSAMMSHTNNGLCTECKYNLRGNESGRCPECGTPIPEQQRDDLACP